MLASMSRIREGRFGVAAGRVISIPPSRVSLSEDGSGNPVLNLGPTWIVPGRASVVRWSRANGALKTSTAAWACTTSTWRKKPRRKTRSLVSSAVCSAARRPRKSEARAERYQVRLSKVGENVQVTVEKNINTVAPADVARKVLSVIQDNLG
jgi:outer membrane protein assembly factor BamC